MSNLFSKEMTCNRRVHAIEAMKGPPHPSFLGRQTEVCQAFDADLKTKQCCYLCQGMMGYIIPATFKPKDVKSYLCHLQWQIRDRYVYSCAEIDATMQ